MNRALKSYLPHLLGTALLLSAFAAPAAHAEGICVLGIVCIGTGGGNGSGGKGSATPDAPEISPAMLTSGLAILGGAGMIIRSRRKKQAN